EKLQAELKAMYWAYDVPRESMMALNKLIRDAPSMDLNVFIMRYAKISKTLVDRGALSPLDRVTRLMDGLTPRLQDKVLEFCATKDWRLSPNELSDTDPDFGELQKFILTKAQMEQKRTAYMMGRSFHSIGSDEKDPSLPANWAMTIPPALRSSTDRPSTPSPATQSAVVTACHNGQTSEFPHVSVPESTSP